MKITKFFAAVMVIGWVMLSSISFGYSGGDGSAGNPYQIAGKADLLSLITDYTNYNKCFILTADIDLEGKTFDTALISPGWFPPRPLPAFSGTFDGNGYVIFNLTINRTTSYGDAYLGLFGVSYGQIENLGLKDVEINVNYSISPGVGGLVGCNYGTITHCYTSGIIKYFNTFPNEVGGLVGRNAGNVIDCYANTEVRGYQFVGGLVGINYNGNISNCYSNGFVSGYMYVGGLAGHNSNGSVNNSFWDKNTSGQTTSAGGTGKTTAQMKTLSTFTSAAWDFADTWAICEGTNYPRLQWQIPAGDVACPDGVGTEDLSALSSCWLETVQAKSDVNDDDKVNFEDVLRLSQNWLLTDCAGCNGADITEDDNVNELDLAVMTEQWLLIENTGCRMMDLNADGWVDLADWSVFAANWLE